MMDLRNGDMPKHMLTVRLRLRDKHSSELNRQARAVNFVWNYCNETSKTAWSRDRKWLSAYALGKLTAGVSKELGLNANTIEKVCQQFARSRDMAKRAGIRWRGRGSLGWVPFRDSNVRFDGECFTFLGAKYDVMHHSPHLTEFSELRAGSFNQDSRGRWFINVTLYVEKHGVLPEGAVGIDLGLKDLASLSDGTKIKAPMFYRKSELALAKAQRARKPKRVRVIHMKMANRRRDFLHKASINLAKKFGLIVIGDVSSSQLARTSMAKSINDAGWYDFKRMLSYKAILHGGKTIEVNERYTTQTCSECGRLPNSRPRGIAGLGVREWECSDCGTVHDRDVNAARNILRVGLDALAEGAA